MEKATENGSLDQESTLQVFCIKAEAKKFDSSDDVVAALGGDEAKFDELDGASGIKLSGNSYGFEAC